MSIQKSQDKDDSNKIDVRNERTNLNFPSTDYKQERNNLELSIDLTERKRQNLRYHTMRMEIKMKTKENDKKLKTT